MKYQEISSEVQLREYCLGLAQCRSIAFDTEFISEHTFRPQLCLLQVSADNELALIDGMSIEDMTPFWEALSAPGHETIVHAGRGEVEFCLRAVDRAPAGMFDVQIAAGLVGIEFPAGYGTLIHKLLAEKPSKHETRTDWRRRPLSKRQIEYALLDVHYLPALRNILHSRLEQLGRLSWMEEEMAAWQKDIADSMTRDGWQRLRGKTGLDGRALAILRELSCWREAEAMRRNQPARRVLRDDLMVELARRGASEPDRIRALRGMERRDLQRRIDEIAACIKKGQELPKENCPAKTRIENQVIQSAVLGQFLFAALSGICRQAHVAPNLVGTPNDIRELISYDIHGNKSKTPPRLAQGWRAEFVGRLFEDLISGKMAVRITDPLAEMPLSFESPKKEKG
ncbi:MAG: ribonuclease D [Thermoguttaceae bacterium]